MQWVVQFISTALFIFLSPALAQANLITYEFSGMFDRVLNFDVNATPDVEISNLFHVIFTYDNDAPLFSINTLGTRARYNTGTISAMSGSNNYSAVNGSQLQIFDNWEFSAVGPAIDDFFLSVHQLDTIGSGFYLLQFNMRDYTTTLLSDLKIPTISQIESLANNGRFFLRRFSTYELEEWEADGPFSSITRIAILEPRIFELLGVGLISIALMRRKQKDFLNNTTD